MSATPGYVLSGNEYSWSDTYPANSSGTYVITGILNGSFSGSIVNNASISGPYLDVNTGNNSTSIFIVKYIPISV